MRTLQVSDFFLSEKHAFCLFDMNHQTMENVHRHEFDELVIVRNGSGFHIINDHVEFICKGDVFLVSASDIHCYESTNNLSIINVLLHKERRFHFINNLEELLEGVKHQTLSSECRQVSLTEEELLKIMHWVNAINTQSDGIYDQRYFSSVESDLLSIIVTISHCAERKGTRITNTEAGKRHLLNYLRDNYASRINWGYLCEESGVAKRTMFRFIKEITGYTPEKFQQRYRLLKTQELLRTSDYPIGEIASRCGFANTSRLTECYKKQFKRTPSQERTRTSNSVF